MTQWIRNEARARLLARGQRAAAMTDRPLCVYHEMGECSGPDTLEHVIARSEWGQLRQAADAGSVVAAKRLAKLTEQYGGMNHPRNLVVACMVHNATRRDLAIQHFAPESCLRLVQHERMLPVAA